MPAKARYSEYEFAKGWASVSQVCGSLEKPYLYGWYAKLGAEATRINTDSKKIGNLIDNEICIYFGDKETSDLDRSVLELPENKTFFNQALKNFYKVAEQITAKSVVGQQVVYSRKHKYIGTFDRLLILKSQLVLSDWKATHSVDYAYLMQLEAYYRALIEMIEAGEFKLPEELKDTPWNESQLLLAQFPKKEEVDLKKHIVPFKSSDLRFNNFLHLLEFIYGKQKDEEENKILTPYVYKYKAKPKKEK